MSQKQRGAAWIEAPRTDVSVVTIVAGRRGHLARQLEGLQRQQRPADHLAIVRMDRLPVDVPAGVAGTVQVLDLPLPPDRLHLAAARNLGVRSTSGGTVVLLDVDCIPGAGLVSAYAGAAEAVDGLLCGGLRYLEPGQPSPGWSEPDLMKASAPHPARPVSGPGQLVRDDRHELAWTTSLAFRRESFDRICGFDERFQGYGGEDTDFAFRARNAGLGVWWCDDAVAYHQHHPTQNPPVQHLEDIVRNAALFAELHGWYPMQGWLETFRDRGLIDFDPEQDRLALMAPA
jgi:N-acetylglucosaminyl-diphospho-decaprenol L-rhamnosyltransferase